MGTEPLTTSVTLRIDRALFSRLQAHLFPGDSDEHGAVIAVGVAESAAGTRLLARELFLARDGVDYVPGEFGYRALSARFVAETSNYCRVRNLGYLAVHCHGGSNQVAFSGDDLGSHERGYPALLAVTNGGPVGALVFAQNAVAGDIWTVDGRRPLKRLTVIGPHTRDLYPEPGDAPSYISPIYQRHSLLFGSAGQEILSGLKVGIVGLGGGGSLLNEWLSRLGVGHVVAIDRERLDHTNLPRVVGASRRDCAAWLQERRWSWLRRAGQRLARRKVDIARDVATRAKPDIIYERIFGDIADEHVARRLTDTDFIYLATDNIQSRLVFNALVQQYLIPGAQVGVKVLVDSLARRVANITTATRSVLPGVGGGCLVCQEVVPSDSLQEEALDDDERQAQRYVEDPEVHAPSVITLNVLSAAQAANDLMMMFTGLYDDDVKMTQHLNFVGSRQLKEFAPLAHESCIWCGTMDHAKYACGDRARLPCRQKPS